MFGRSVREQPVACHNCGKTDREVLLLVNLKNILVCDVCIALCADIVRNRIHDTIQQRAKVLTPP